MKALFLLSFFSALAAATPIAIPPALHGTEALPFTPHVGPGAFDSYVAIDLPFAPAEIVRHVVEARLGKPLRHRGEAHITALTPPEYHDVLRPYLTMETINEVARQQRLPQAPFDVVCVGRGEAVVDGKAAHTYFLVVDSPQLVAFRQELFRRYVDAGGAPSRFDPLALYAHVTLGFTSRDLHESDGVKKGRNSCWERTVTRRRG